MPEKIDQINKLIKALPLPKKGLYKLKDNINLDDYIVILQSKKENKTYTIDASELGDSSTGIQSLTAGDNITVDDTDPLNPIVSASLSLFPDGMEIVPITRAIQESDFGKLLVLTAGVNLTLDYGLLPSTTNFKTFGIVALDKDNTFEFYPETPCKMMPQSPAFDYTYNSSGTFNHIINVGDDGEGQSSLTLLGSGIKNDIKDNTFKTAERYAFDNLPIAGQATLTTGTVTIADTRILSTSVISVTGVGSTGAGFLSVTTTDGVGFTIDSSNNSDSRTINYFIKY